MKTFATLMTVPGHEQVKVLRKMKTDRKQGVYYGATYYAPARRAIRNYYKQNNNVRILEQEIRRLSQQKAQNHRTRNNIRAIEAFRDSQMSEHLFELRPITRYSFEVGEVTIGCRPDLILREGDQDTYVFLNFSKEDLPEETVRLTLELTHYIFADRNVDVPFRRLQYVFLEKDLVRSWIRPRVRTFDQMIATANVVSHLWDMA